MKSKLFAFLALALLAGVHQAAAQGTRFFRISGPASTTILSFTPDGTLVWSNASPGATYTIQTVSSPLGGNNWLDYVQLPTSNGVNTNLLIDFNPPAGMTLIPAGVFVIGDTLDSEGDATPTISVTVSAFYMDVNLVSLSQWQSVYSYATNHGYGFVHAGLGKAANHPVQLVNWYDCVKWSNARSQQAGLTEVYYTDAGLTQVYTNRETTNIFANWTAKGFRLPTEAEWEKAARGGLSGQRFPWGNTLSESQANYYSCFCHPYDLSNTGYNPTFNDGVAPYTSPVGYFAANGYGLYDMAGNVFAWCWDWYGTPYAGGSDPHGPAGPLIDRVLRGGNWSSMAYGTRCAIRYYGDPGVAYNYIGFRCVRGL